MRNVTCRIQGLTLVIVALQAGCAGKSLGEPDFEQLVIENASPDVVRVSLELDEHEVILGRISPMTRAGLRIRPGMIAPGLGRARIRVVALGMPTVAVIPGRVNPNAPPSDWYSVEELLGHTWRYAGNRVLPMRSVGHTLSELPGAAPGGGFENEIA